MALTSKQRYQKYRDAHLAQSRRRHELDKAYPEYVALVALRKQICNIRVSIDFHESRADQERIKLKIAYREKEKLTEAWKAKRRELGREV